MQQADCVSDYTALTYMEELIEYDKTDIIFTVFTVPKANLTEDYLSGKFG